MGRKSAKDMKQLIENDKAFKAKLDSLDIKVEDFISAAEEQKKENLNELYEDWKRRNEGLPDVPPEPDNPPEPDTPPEPTGDVLYDSHIHSKLHDGQVRTIDKSEGEITPNGLGIEMHASGNPRVVVNADGTFSLFGDAGFPRFYGYVCNYDATLEIEAAFWNDVGQDLSLKTRSRHNEGGACENRFGGYGLAVDRNGYDAKREVCHNVHDESQSGRLPTTPKTGEYFTIRWTVKDQGTSVRQLGEMNGQAFLNKVDSDPKPYMVDKASFENQSYFWVRQNIDKGTGEIRIKSLRILKA